ncbi:MAG: hypothetical protein IBX70_02000 [Clostridia bacterium]|nr:hypothetical protein [Clostridia bacterium]
MILGIDTSCYTTSFIVLSIETGEILFEDNRLLKVKNGERGLRQSEGFFKHSGQLTEIFEEMSRQLPVAGLKAIALSSRPRNIENSYMPVFHAGLLFCRNISTALRIPLYEFSHQEGHIKAALKTCGLDDEPSHFISMHLSGGTTELLDVKNEGDRYEINIIGRTLDINFGQLIDRIGVGLGLSFPAGREMDELASTSDCESFFKVDFKFHEDFNISGLENKYMKMMGSHETAYVCKHIFNTIGRLIELWIEDRDKEIPIVLVGGVASNRIIKAYLEKKANVYFASPDYSRDNAYGIAELGRIRFWRR